MYQQDVCAGKYFPEFPTEDVLNEFLKAFNNVVKTEDLPCESN